MSEAPMKCVEPARGVVAAQGVPDSATEPQQQEGVPRMAAQVGKPAPDFEAAAYVKGAFQNVKLSDYRGQWVVVCFYPGDFTFV